MKQDRNEKEKEIQELNKLEFGKIHSIYKRKKSPDALQINVEKRKIERLLK